MKIFIFLFLILNIAQANSELKFRPDYWTRGLHLNAGGGLNASYFDSDEQLTGLGYGLNFKTDLGYFFTNRFALEWSANVKFNKLSDYLIWDTLITGGFRYRIKEYYLRGFYGKAPTVIFFDGNPPNQYSSKINRIQFDGPVYGVAIGRYFQYKKDLVWFLETSGSFQRLNKKEGIKMDGEVPEVISVEKDKSTVLSVYLMAGILIF